MAPRRRRLWAGVGLLCLAIVGAAAFLLTRPPAPNYDLAASASCFRSRGYRVTQFTFDGYPGIAVFAPGFVGRGGLPLVFTPSPAAANRVEQAHVDSDPSQTHRNVAPMWEGLTDEPIFACLRSH